MIREIPPLAVEGIDPWEKVQIDPATRRLAESAAAAADLTVEEWLERAIRRACPSAFHAATATIPSSPVLTQGSAAVPAAPALVIVAPPPEIEASLTALLAMAQGQHGQQAPLEARQPAPIEPPPAPVPISPPAAPVIQQAAPLHSATMIPLAPAATPPTSLRGAPTLAEAFVSPVKPQEERPAAALRMFARDEHAAPKQRFDLWATRDTDADADEAREIQPQTRREATRFALIAIGVALAITAGAVTAQYLVPGRSPVSAPSSIANSSVPTSNPLPLPSISGDSIASTALPPSLPPSSANVPPIATSNSSDAPPSSLASVSAQPVPVPAPQTTEPAVAPPAAKSETVKPETVTNFDSTKPATATQKPTPLTKGQPAPAPVPAQLAAAPATAPAGAKTAKIEPSDTAPTDPKALASWLEQRAKNGDAIAQYRLGVLYALAQGVQQDYQHAARLFETSAEAGVAEAQYNIAVMYGEGLGIGRDPVQAVRWYQKAAAQGNANAAFNLGVAYSNGVGVPQSMDQAAQWFRRAASAGVINAQFNLGLLYERGDGVPVSQVEAYAWYNAAAAHGDQGAAQRRDHLASTLAPPTLKEAQARAQQIAREIQGGGNASDSLATKAAFKKP